jgi:hypothetical protein
MIAYDGRGMTWDQYNKLMEELFASNQLGHVPEKDWRQWVDGINGIGYFVQSGVPDHRGFENWQDWAKATAGIMSIMPNLGTII